MRRLVLGAVAAAVLFTLVALGGVVRPGSAHSAAAQSARQITVVGSSVVEIVPDAAGFGFGVVTRAKTAADALAANAAAAGRLVAALKGAGIAAANLQTQGVSLQPRFDKTGTSIVGYDATNTVSATIRPLDRVGAVVDAAVAAGADQVSGPSFSISNRDALYKQALADAYADARVKATALAAKAGGTLGAAVQVAEGGASQAQYVQPASQSAAQKVEPGTETVTASLTVTFALG